MRFQNFKFGIVKVKNNVENDKDKGKDCDAGKNNVVERCYAKIWTLKKNVASES